MAQEPKTRKVAVQAPFWNPHFGAKEGKIIGKSGDYLKGVIVKIRTEGLSENFDAMVDVRITGESYYGATVGGRNFRSLPDSKDTLIATWPLTDTYRSIIDDLSGCEGHYLKVVYQGARESRKSGQSPSAKYDVEVSPEPVTERV